MVGRPNQCFLLPKASASGSSSLSADSGVGSGATGVAGVGAEGRSLSREARGFDRGRQTVALDEGVLSVGAFIFAYSITIFVICTITLHIYILPTSVFVK